MSDRNESAGRTGRRIGYLIAIALNFGFLVIVNNVVEWGWFSWITPDLDRVLPIINVSVVATILANAVYFAYDPRWLKAIAEIGLLVISLIATIRMLRVFPFDFSAYDFAWDTLVRWLLGIAIFGIAAGIVAQVGKLARLVRSGEHGS